MKFTMIRLGDAGLRWAIEDENGIEIVFGSAHKRPDGILRFLVFPNCPSLDLVMMREYSLAEISDRIIA